MNIKSLFARKSSTIAPERPAPRAPDARLDLEALDACVGGRADDQGVGCYGQTTQSRAQ